VTPTRDGGLDALRGIACLLVFFHHVDANYGLAGGLFRGGGIAGVFTFFVLSGFLLYRPFLEGPVGLGGYAVRRFARIYPAYLFALVGLSILTQSQVFWQHAPQYLLFIQNADAQLFQGFLGVSWTLAMEVGFYIFLPLIAWAVRGDPRRLLALAVPSLAAWLVVQAFAGPTLNVTVFPLYGWMFAAGMLLAMAVHRGWQPGRRALSGIALIAIAMFIARPLGRADNAFHYAVMVLLVEAGAAMVAAWLLVNPPGLRWRPLVVFGGALSYAFYLWHADMIGLARGLELSPLGLTVAAFMLTLPFAALSWLLVEKPAMRAARRFLAHDARRKHEVLPAPAPMA
jgi:peptidoglycan/LPS O-acetylase OafA/YrhL